MIETQTILKRLAQPLNMSRVKYRPAPGEGIVPFKDFLEPLGRILQKARLNVELPPELKNLIVPRSTTYIFARIVCLIDSKEEAYEIGAMLAGRPVRLRTRKDSKSKKAAISAQSLIEVT